MPLITRSHPYSKSFRKQRYQTSNQRLNNTLKRIRRPLNSGHVIPLDSASRALTDYIFLMNHPWSAKLVAMPSGLSNPCRLIKVSFDFEVLPFRFTQDDPGTINQVAVVMFGKPYNTDYSDDLVARQGLNPTSVVSLFGKRKFVSFVDAPKTATAATTHANATHLPIRCYGTLNLSSKKYGPLGQWLGSAYGTQGSSNGYVRSSLIGSGSPNLSFSGIRTSVLRAQLNTTPQVSNANQNLSVTLCQQFMADTLALITGATNTSNAQSALLNDGFFETNIQYSDGALYGQGNTPVRAGYNTFGNVQGSVPGFQTRTVAPVAPATDYVTYAEWPGGVTPMIALETAHAADSLPAAFYCTEQLNPFSGSLPQPSEFGGPGTSVRSIAQGVQLYCTTPAEKRKGSLFCLELNGHQGVADTTLNMLKATTQDTVRRYPLAGIEGCHMTWHPQAPYDFVVNSRGLAPGEVAGLPAPGANGTINLQTSADVNFIHDLTTTLTNPTSTVAGQQTHTDTDLAAAGISGSLSNLYSTPTMSVSHSGGSVAISDNITIPAGTVIPVDAAQVTNTQGSAGNNLVNFVGESAVGNFTNLMFFESLDPTEKIIATYTHVYEINDPYSDESTFPLDSKQLSAAASTALMAYSSGRSSYTNFYGDSSHTRKIALAAVV